MSKNITWSSATVGLLLACTAFTHAQAASDSEHINRTLALGSNGLVKVRNFAGYVTISATDGSDVIVDAVRHGSPWQLEGSRLDIRAEGNSVVVDANQHARGSWFSWGRHSVPEVDLDIKMPRHARLDVSVFSSPVDVRGVDGDCRIHAFSARLTAEDVTGAIDAHTFSGPVRISGRAWGGKPITVDTFSGSVDLSVPDAAQGTVTFKSFSGRLNSDRPIVVRERSRRSMTAELGTEQSLSGPHSDVRLKTFSGNVRIAR